MRKFIPYRLRLSFSLLKMHIRYFIRGYTFRMGKASGNIHFEYISAVSQPVFQTSTSANKIHNLKLASTHIRKYVFQPGEYISFWHMTGVPAAEKGYLPGRNLVNGVLKEEPGGGLCQLSGLMYHLALVAGLEIVERYNHSVDIYREEERFTPLGADATVVYGYKNLLLRNTTGNPLYFEFMVTEDRAEGRICSAGPLKESELRFEREEKDKKRIVHTFRNGLLLNTSVYGIKNPA